MGTSGDADEHCRFEAVAGVLGTKSCRYFGVKLFTILNIKANFVFLLRSERDTKPLSSYILQVDVPFTAPVTV